VDPPSEVSRNIQFALDERLVDDHFGGYVGEFGLTPRFDLPTHRLEVPLHPVHSYGDCIDKGKRLRVLGKHRGEDCGSAKDNFRFERTVRYRQE
jgi:hypothetical protein